jgi:hypothetical protein
MPKLVIFAPCEKLIIAEDTHAASIINLLWGTQIVIAAPQSTDDLKIPFRWNVFCLWQEENGDTGKTFEQTIQLVVPSGRVHMSSSQEFQITKAFHRIVTNIDGFPVTEDGRYVIRALLREVPTGAEASETASCYLTVVHTPPE